MVEAIIVSFIFVSHMLIGVVIFYLAIKFLDNYDYFDRTGVLLFSTAVFTVVGLFVSFFFFSIYYLCFTIILSLCIAGMCEKKEGVTDPPKSRVQRAEEMDRINDLSLSKVRRKVEMIGLKRSLSPSELADIEIKAKKRELEKLQAEVDRLNIENAGRYNETRKKRHDIEIEIRADTGETGGPVRIKSRNNNRVD
jgi:hypothetical protein